jgi:hypothetical protein
MLTSNENAATEARNDVARAIEYDRAFATNKAALGQAIDGADRPG